MVPGAVIRAQDLLRVPWKNGGGTTAQVAAFPEASSLDDFGWRISMADVKSDGPFSAFPGIDRTLIVLEGGGIELDVDGKCRRLDPASPLLSFSGDAPTFGRLLAGPIRDLNIMTRRGSFVHRATFPGPGPILLLGGTCAAFLIALESVGVTVADSCHALAPLDTLRLGSQVRETRLDVRGRTILVEISPEV